MQPGLNLAHCVQISPSLMSIKFDNEELRLNPGALITESREQFTYCNPRRTFHLVNRTGPSWAFLSLFHSSYHFIFFGKYIQKCMYNMFRPSQASGFLPLSPSPVQLLKRPKFKVQILQAGPRPGSGWPMNTPKPAPKIRGSHMISAIKIVWDRSSICPDVHVLYV